MGETNFDIFYKGESQKSLRAFGGRKIVVNVSVTELDPKVLEVGDTNFCHFLEAILYI